MATPGNFQRILEGEEQARSGALVRPHLENVLAVEQDLAVEHFVIGLAGDHVGQRRFAGPVGPHDGRHLALVHGEVEAVEDALVLDLHDEVLDLEHVDFLHRHA